MKSFIMKENKYFLFSILLILSFWEVISIFVNREIILPSPYLTFKSVINIINDKDFFIIILATIKRTLLGFGIALIFGIILGCLSGIVNNMHIFLNPIITFMKSAPTMGLIILALIWLNSENAPIAIGIMVVFPIIYNNIYLGIKQIDKKLIEMASLYKISKKDMFFLIYLPSLKPYIKSSILGGVGLNLKVIIAAEVVSQPKFGIGTIFQIERANLNTSAVFGWILIVVIMVYIFDTIIEFIFSRNMYNLFKKIL